jgi:hypothetical protein
MDADTGGDGTTMELEFRRALVNFAQIPKFNELDMCAVFHWRTPVPLTPRYSRHPSIAPVEPSAFVPVAPLNQAQGGLPP